VQMHGMLGSDGDGVLKQGVGAGGLDGVSTDSVGAQGVGTGGMVG
jgi:hypothetical protein